MLMGQPVVYELPLLRVPTTLFVGVHDRTTFGKAAAPPEVHARLGDYRSLGRRAADAIPGAVLVEYRTLGIRHISRIWSGFIGICFGKLPGPMDC